MPIKNYEHGCSTTQAMASLGKIEGVMPLLHGPQPCAYQNQVSTLPCRPAQLITAGTLVSKSEVVFGGDDSLKTQIRNLHSKYKPKIIVVINTCVPQMIGDDVEGIAVEMERELDDVRITTVKTGFNYSSAMLRGSDASWVAILEALPPLEKEAGSIGIIGRAGQDAGNMGGVEVLLRKAGLRTHLFPAGHIDQAAQIARASRIYPIHVGPYMTCKALTDRFEQECVYIEIPVGIQGTSNFYRAVAEREGCQALYDLVDQEEARIAPEVEEVKARFARDKVRLLLVSGPANEMSLGKILAEFGAEVFIVPSMKNKFYKTEKAIMEQRHGVTFIEDDFESLEQLVEEIQPTAVAAEFQGQPETTAKLIPTITPFFFLGDYGYDYAANMGKNFRNIIKQPVWSHWQRLSQRYGA